jgi:hypothetical protein
MRFYRVHTSRDGGNSGGFEFFTRRREAEACVARFKREVPDEFADFDVIDIEPTKSGILKALKRYAAHEMNG